MFVFSVGYRICITISWQVTVQFLEIISVVYFTDLVLVYVKSIIKSESRLQWTQILG